MEDQNKLALATLNGEIIKLGSQITGISPEEAANRDALVAAGKEIVAVESFEDQQQALARRNDLKEWCKRNDDSFSSVKREVDALGKKLLRMKEANTAPAEPVINTLNGMINNFQIKVDQERREKEAAIERERQRIADEAAAAQRLQEEAERKRRQAEIELQQAEALKGKQKQAAIDKANQDAAEAQRLADEAFEKSLAAETTTTTVEPEPAPEGKVAKKTYDFQLIDPNGHPIKDNSLKEAQALLAFANAQPTYTKIEIRRGLLLEAINSGAIKSAPGIRIYEKLKDLR